MRFFGADYYALQAKKLAMRGARSRLDDIETIWRGARFTDVRLGTVTQSFISRTKLESLPLSGEQKTRLRLRLRQLLDYFCNPTLKDYYLLKTLGLHYRFIPSDQIKMILARGARHAPTLSLNSPKYVTRALWERIHSESLDFGPPRLTAIALESILANTSRTNSGKALLSGPVRKGVTIAMEALNPGFVYSGVGPDAAPPNGLFFELSFFAKANGSENSAPVYISLYWSDRDRDWALNRMITDQLLRVKTIF